MVAKKKVSEVKSPSLSDLIDELDTIRDKKRVLDAQVKPLEERYKELKTLILEKLDEEGTAYSGTARATVKISLTTVPVVKDITALIKYLTKEKYLHVFLAQPMSTPSWRELVERKGGDLPGTETFVKRDLNHSSLKGT